VKSELKKAELLKNKLSFAPACFYNTLKNNSKAAVYNV
jgi:hypothetical protein